MMKFETTKEEEGEEVDWKLLANKLQLIISGANNFGDGISDIFSSWSSRLLFREDTQDAL